MCSAVATYVSSSNTNMSAYEDLPGHHLISIRNLVATTPDDSYPESADDAYFFVENITAPEWDYSGVHNLEAFLSFPAVVDYCLTCSDDSSKGDYDPTRECSMVERADGQIDDASSDDGNGEANPQANQVVAPAANQAASSSLAARQAQLVQLQELEARLEEECRQTRKLRTALEQERTARGACAQAAGHVAQERILADDDVDNPLDQNRASQKLVTAAYLLQAMPEPSTPEGCNLRDEAQVLIEQATVQQAECSASHAFGGLD
jgi:hypothetical protein